ncbi:MAG: rhomboid family intramembrane serine protease [Clostridia bacterium]|nr:rhomboid family intramembrane serine protease [Clostridia bacterium]
MFSKLLDRLESRYGRYRGIRNLMSIIVFSMAAVYVVDMVLGPTMGFSLSSWLSFDKSAIMRGQIWRLFTFVFVPYSGSMFGFVFSLVFSWLMGQTLQNDWGTFRFTLYYLIGMLGTVLAGCITGYATGYYLNLSLILACAILYPEAQINLYIIPLRMKWLALIYLVMLLGTALESTWPDRIALIISLLNVILFFMDRMVGLVKDARRRQQWRRNWR